MGGSTLKVIKKISLLSSSIFVVIHSSKGNNTAQPGDQEVPRRRAKPPRHRACPRGRGGAWIQFSDSCDWIWMQTCHLDFRKNMIMKMKMKRYLRNICRDWFLPLAQQNIVLGQQSCLFRSFGPGAGKKKFLENKEAPIACTLLRSRTLKTFLGNSILIL